MTAPLDRPPLPEEMEVFGSTDIGKVRKVNQDHFLLCSLQKHTQVHQTSLPEDEQPSVGSEQVAYLAMVADGVGGGAGGGRGKSTGNPVSRKLRAAQYGLLLQDQRC
jgi:serine/threonine protein phosphatase PrpC